MLTAILSDIHGNREALEACLAHLEPRNVGRYVFLGDYVGYGADPGFVVDTVKDFVAQGAVALLGNHDSAAIGMPERMNDEATRAIAWTRRQLDAAQLEFLASRPLTAADDDRLYVHASAADPAAWDYVLEERSAGRSLQATDAVMTFCGHTHVPALFHLTAPGKIAGFDPDAGVAMPLTRRGRWLAAQRAGRRPPPPPPPSPRPVSP